MNIFPHAEPHLEKIDMANERISVKTVIVMETAASLMASLKRSWALKWRLKYNLPRTKNGIASTTLFHGPQSLASVHLVDQLPGFGLYDLATQGIEAYSAQSVTLKKELEFIVFSTHIRELRVAPSKAPSPTGRFMTATHTGIKTSTSECRQIFIKGEG
uniref:Uncharacterized protein n=1 Tax=Romanomermis culicivorax TaxID=13658 RepID=A0A915HSQ5_ROMCU